MMSIFAFVGKLLRKKYSMVGRKTEPPRAVDRPETGFFRMRLVRKGPFVAAQINHQNNHWWAVINGDKYPPAADPAAAPYVFDVWLAGERITEDEYNYLTARRTWAAQHAPRDPANAPRQRVDTAFLPPLF
jgi:hypothetical protein